MITKAAFFSNQPASLDKVYGNGRKDRLAQFCDLYPVIISAENFDVHVQNLHSVEVIFSTWGMPKLNATQLDKLPSLKAVFYAAGSVKFFAEPFLRKQVLVISAWAANAVPVAEFTISQILLATKGYFRNIRDCATPEGRKNPFVGVGNYGTTITLLGAGMVGRKVIERLAPFDLNVLVFDPFLSSEDAAKLGVEKVTLEEAITRGQVVSNHLANVPETKGLLRAFHFQALPENAVFLNTGRGATVVESDLVTVLKQRPDLTALLDVTDPEPSLAESDFYRLPNVFLSSHIAGSIGGEVNRMADTVIEEYLAWQSGKLLRYAVTLEMLATMA